MSQFMVSIFMMVCVAYYIVIERKGLGMVQRRHGPNKVSFKGFLQPIADGVKLFTKEIIVPSAAGKSMFFLGPFVCFFCAYSLWVLYPNSIPVVRFEFGLLFFLCVSSFSVYGVFLVGWICDSRYAFLGAMRAVAQTVSYEIFLSTLLFCPLILVQSFDLIQLRQFSFVVLLIGQEVLILWLISVLAETHRAPFDFVEGESELVSGYSVEYGGVGFALLALGEYSNMMFMSMITACLYFSFVVPVCWWGDFIFAFLFVLISYFLIWVRGTLPRYRYDLLMKVCWEIFLPVSLCIFIIFMGFWELIL
uniref:NADH-ubiquinone oxidoreductase chain 1 n=1 Tax=Callista chinensis TaxID=990943 RepID=A0A889QIP9_9BIVA|nr:NADH dehydrogenase subunit 1 [Callista chinensis]QRE83918.1 NADH dehydrogenase subunit 1 [Callista chinensis]QWM94237.1 NADH dehydrogenase subunit 1 [Callista chinensis]